jgi:ArsR family transcriptional regulator
MDIHIFHSMSTTMTEPGLDLILRQLKAVADEKRLRILTLLAGGERCVCELQDALEAGQSLLSHHLRTLKEVGLVSDRREGRWVFYALNREAVGELEEFLRTTRTSEEPVFPPARCCE